MTHEVLVLCDCADDPCRMEVYVSDVRIAYSQIRWLEFERDLLSDCVENIHGDQAA